MSNEHDRAGVLFTLTAFTFWGFVPLYFKLIEGVNHLEIVAHRIVWTASALFVILIIFSRFRWLGTFAVSHRTFGLLCVSAGLLGMNWIAFTWAATSDRVLDTSLGYFINPLLNVLLGVVFLHERLRGAQQVAVFLAAVGVAILVVHHGTIPWVALVLPLAFGMYGLIRKQLAVNPLYGLFLEMLILTPVALVLLGYVGFTRGGAFSFDDLSVSGLLMCGAPISIIPLTCFVAGAKRINLSTIAFIQYLAPSITFLLAVFVFREPFGTVQMITFGLIWVSLVVFSIDGFRATRAEAGAQPDPELIPK